MRHKTHVRHHFLAAVGLDEVNKIRGQRIFFGLVGVETQWSRIRILAFLHRLGCRRRSANGRGLDARLFRVFHAGITNSGWVLRHGLHDRETCRDALVQLLRLKALQELLLNQTEGYRVFNEQALRGERVDAVVKPGPLNLPRNSSHD